MITATHHAKMRIHFEAMCAATHLHVPAALAGGSPEPTVRPAGPANVPGPEWATWGRLFYDRAAPVHSDLCLRGGSSLRPAPPRPPAPPVSGAGAAGGAANRGDPAVPSRTSESDVTAVTAQVAASFASRARGRACRAAGRPLSEPESDPPFAPPRPAHPLTTQASVPRGPAPPPPPNPHILAFLPPRPAPPPPPRPGTPPGALAGRRRRALWRTFDMGLLPSRAPLLERASNSACA